MGNAGQSNYAASKAGLIGLTKSLAKELAGGVSPSMPSLRVYRDPDDATVAGSGAGGVPERHSAQTGWDRR